MGNRSRHVFALRRRVARPESSKGVELCVSASHVLPKASGRATHNSIPPEIQPRSRLAVSASTRYTPPPILGPRSRLRLSAETPLHATRRQSINDNASCPRGNRAHRLRTRDGTTSSELCPSRHRRRPTRASHPARPVRAERRWPRSSRRSPSRLHDLRSRGSSHSAKHHPAAKSKRCHTCCRGPSCHRPGSRRSIPIHRAARSWCTRHVRTACPRCSGSVRSAANSRRSRAPADSASGRDHSGTDVLPNTAATAVLTLFVASRLPLPQSAGGYPLGG